MLRIHLRRNVFILSAFILATLIHHGHGADASSSESWDVESLVAQALAHNAELKFYAAEVAAAKGQRTQAGLWKNPEVSGEYGTRRISDTEGTLQGDGFTRSVALSQTFEFPGKGSLRKAIANKDIEIAELGLKQFQLALTARVQMLAYRYQSASINATAAEEISERSHALIELLKKRPIAGVTQLLELRVIEGSLIELHRTAKEFMQEREEARLELNALIGRPSSQSLVIRSKFSPPAYQLDANQLILAGLNQNLQLKGRIAELEKTVRQVSAARLETAPDFSIGPFFSQDKAGDLEENFGGSLSMTLPFWNWNQGNVATAKARREQADALLLEARRKVESEIARRCRAYELCRKQLNQMPADIIDKLRDASDLADRQYRTGAVNVQLFLEVQREFLNAQKIRNEATVDLWSHWFDLALLTGGAIPLTPSISQATKTEGTR